MELATAIQLVENAVDGDNQTWADLGMGEGLFTLALAARLRSSTIYGIDLRKPTGEIKLPIGGNRFTFIKGDFTDVKNIPHYLDGVVLANSLHFVHDKKAFITLLQQKLKPGGKILIIEYDLETPNTWVPYPVSYNTLTGLFKSLRLPMPQRVGSAPSNYHKSGIYAALSILE